MTDATEFLVGHGGLVLFAFVFAEDAGLPLPAAPLLLAAGALAADGKLNPVLAVAATALAALLADSLWFYVGRRGGQRVVRLFCRLSLSRNSCVGRTKNLFANRGLGTLVAAKFIPGLGAVMPPLAGALGMSTSRFLLFDGLGSLFYGGTYVLAGFLFHNQLGRVLGLLRQLGFGALLLALGLVLGYIAFRYARRHQPLGGEPRHADMKHPKEVVLAESRPRIVGATQHGAGRFLGESLGALEFPRVSLAVSSVPMQPVTASPAAPLISNSL